MEKVSYVLEHLERKVLELLVTDLLASLLVWQGKEVNEEEMIRLLSARVLTKYKIDTPEEKQERAMRRQEDHRAMAEKRAEEGVMTPDERTPIGCDAHEGGTR